MDLQSKVAFQNLGEPIQALLLMVAGAGDLPDAALEQFSHVTVRQMARVYDMLGSGEDADKILAWLRRAVRRNLDADDPYGHERARKIHTGACRDPIAFYKEIERQSIELHERHRLAAELRTKERTANLARRNTERVKTKEVVAHEKKLAMRTGEGGNALTRMRVIDRRDIASTFERFTSKQSIYDNSSKSHDTEWWQVRDDTREDFENNGPKGKLWTLLVENGSTPAADPELAVRQEWYRGQVWWKGAQYRRNWEQTRDTEWWMETVYLRDWQTFGARGGMWCALEESVGFTKKGQGGPAGGPELMRRQAWFKANGPKGVVKTWNALAEGSPDRCPLREKDERDAFYRNGDWWKHVSCVDVATGYAGPAGADREWWKCDIWRKDHDNGGSKWKAVSETNPQPITASAQARRSEWYSQFPWKTQVAVFDFPKGEIWRERSAKDPRPCSEGESQMRSRWLVSADDREGWKDSPSSGRGETDRKRIAWHKENWWKALRYRKAYSEGRAAWKALDPHVGADCDWWKQAMYVEDWRKNSDEALMFWKRAVFLDDFDSGGVRWCEDGPQETELVQRTLWLEENWWLALRYQRDCATGGSLWSVSRRGAPVASQASTREMDRRREGYKARGPMWRASTEADALARNANQFPCGATEALDRAEWYRANYKKGGGGAVEFWKDDFFHEDYLAGGTKWQTVKGSRGRGVVHLTESERQVRESWYKKAARLVCATEEELQLRVSYYRTHTLSDGELKMRLVWWGSRTDEERCIEYHELEDLLVMLNQGMAVSAEDLEAVQKALTSPGECISCGELSRAVAESGVYVAPTDGERILLEQEVMAEAEKEEAARVEEAAAFLAMEAAEELADGAPRGHNDEAEEEELRYVAEHVPPPVPENEDDVVLTEVEESAHDDFLAMRRDRWDTTVAVSPDQVREAFDFFDDALFAGTASGVLDVAKLRVASDALEIAFPERAFAFGPLPAITFADFQDLVKEGTMVVGTKAVRALFSRFAKEYLRRQIAASVEAESVVWGRHQDAVTDTRRVATGSSDALEPGTRKYDDGTKSTIPLREFPNPEFLKSSFTVLNACSPRVPTTTCDVYKWVLDSFSHTLTASDFSGNKVFIDHAAETLRKVERDSVHPLRCRIAFTSESYDVVFESSSERTRFIDTARALVATVFAPQLIAEGHVVIDAVGLNAATMDGKDFNGACTLRVSKAPAESVSLWVGTLDVRGVVVRPDAWVVPRDADVCVITIQTATYQIEDDEWFTAVERHLGKAYETVAKVTRLGVCLLVLARGENICDKISNVETTWVASEVARGRGAVVVSLQVWDSSLCFIACHLPGRDDRATLREHVLEEILSFHDGVGILQPTHCFSHVLVVGNVNSRTDASSGEDELTRGMKEDGVLCGFVEPHRSGKFTPTYRGTDHYTDRVLSASMPGCGLLAHTYETHEVGGEHLAVTATFTVRVPRPALPSHALPPRSLHLTKVKLVLDEIDCGAAGWPFLTVFVERRAPGVVAKFLEPTARGLQWGAEAFVAVALECGTTQPVTVLAQNLRGDVYGAFVFLPPVRVGVRMAGSMYPVTLSGRKVGEAFVSCHTE